MQNPLSNKKITELLPHRQPFLFIDRVISVEGTHKITASRTIKKDESYLKGHFPDNPIVPGVLLVESMAQAAGIISSYNLESARVFTVEPAVYFLSHIAYMKFKHPVYPEDTLIIKAEILRCFGDSVKVSVEGEVGGKVVIEGELVVSKQKGGK